MDTSLHDKKFPESKECAVHNSENASFILGTGKLVTPQKHVAEVTPRDCTPDTFKSPFDFSTVTVEQLGITPESFVKIPSGKSPSYLKKSRRRSTVGARGSPETNHLIRFIAQQRRWKNEQSPLARDSHLQGSPGPYRSANSLREQISAFQSAFHSIQETEMNGSPAVETSGLAKKEGLTKYQQSGFPENLSSKRRRISSQSSPDDHLRSVEGNIMGVQIFRTDADGPFAADASDDLAQKSSKLDSAQSGCVVVESALLPELLEASHAQVSSDPAPDIRLPATPLCKSNNPPSETVVLRSVLKKPGKPFAESLQERHSNLCDGATHPSTVPDPSFCCREQKAGQEDNKTPVSLNARKRKRVTFGEDLSPEVFDQSLPANTPLRKGGTPVRQKDLSDTSPLLLEQSLVPEQLLQPNFDDNRENLENIEPLEVSFAVLSPNKSSISETLSGADTFSFSNNHEKITCKRGRPTRTSNRRKQLVSFAEENVYNSHNAEAEPCKEKKINRRKSQDSKSTNRALPKKKPVCKGCRKTKRKGKKGVQKSLYGERDIASKKPLLSPIPELPEVSETTPSVAGLRRIYPGDFSLTGKLEDMLPLETPMKRKRLLPPSVDLPEHAGSDESDASQLCCSSMPVTASSEGGPSASSRDTEDTNSDPRADRKLENAKEPNTERRSENSHMPCASLTVGHIVSDSPKPVCVPEEFSCAGQNAENLCEILKISESVNVKCEKNEHSAAKGTLQYGPCVSDSEELDCSDVLAGNRKEPTSPVKSAGGKSAENGSAVSGGERKLGGRAVHCCDGQRSHWEQNGSHAFSSRVGSPVESSSENSQLYKDLSDTIEQGFQRANSETKVRRSTRLHGDLGNTGLVWMTLPCSSTSQKTKRRTICTLDSREYQSVSSEKETVSSGQNLGALPCLSGIEAVASRLPGKRRKSFCGSALNNTQSTMKPPGFRKTASQEGSKLSAALRGLDEEN